MSLQYLEARQPHSSFFFAGAFSSAVLYHDAGLGWDKHIGRASAEDTGRSGQAGRWTKVASQHGETLEEPSSTLAGFPGILRGKQLCG